MNKLQKIIKEELTKTNIGFSSEKTHPMYGTILANKAMTEYYHLNPQGKQTHDKPFKTWHEAMNHAMKSDKTVDEAAVRDPKDQNKFQLLNRVPQETWHKILKAHGHMPMNTWTPFDTVSYISGILDGSVGGRSQIHKEGIEFKPSGGNTWQKISYIQHPKYGKIIKTPAGWYHIPVGAGEPSHENGFKTDKSAMEHGQKYYEEHAKLGKIIQFPQKKDI